MQIHIFLCTIKNVEFVPEYVSLDVTTSIIFGYFRHFSISTDFVYFQILFVQDSHKHPQSIYYNLIYKYFSDKLV